MSEGAGPPREHPLRGIGPAAWLVILVVLLAGNVGFVPVGAILVLLWASVTGTPLRELGLVRAPQAAWVLPGAALLGVILKVVMKSLVMPLLGAPAVNERFRFLEGNTAALPAMILTILLASGFGEEVVFRGFGFERMRRALGSRRHATTIALLVTSVIFALAHAREQGVPGVQQALVTGLVFGALYARTGSLAPSMIAHAAFNLTALAMIHLGLEAKVARLFFG